ncbi:hypothetical protein [Larkinella harenae]
MKNRAGTAVFAQQIGKRQPGARLRLDVSNLPDGVYQVVISNGIEETVQHVPLTTHQPSHPARLVVIP